MKSYTITVNGNVYDVTVEENVGGAAPAAPVAPKAAGAGSIKVEFAIGRGYYVHSTENHLITPQLVAKVKERMLSMVSEKIPFKKKAYPLAKAMELFKKQGINDKEKLVRYRRSSYVNIYELDGYFDYYYGYMLPHTGYVKYFDLTAYDEGMMLILPRKQDPTKVEDFHDRPKLYQTLKASQKWYDKIGIETVGDLNERICSGSLSELIDACKKGTVI